MNVASYVLLALFIAFLVLVFIIVARCEVGGQNKSESYKRLHGQACRDCWDFTDGPDDELCAWCKQTPEELEKRARLDLILAIVAVCLIFAAVGLHLETFP